MSKNPWFAVIIAGILFTVLYFACETSPKNIQAAEKSRAANFEITNIQNLLKEAQVDLSPDVKATIETYEFQLKNPTDQEEELEILKNLSSIWYQQNAFAIAGHYAQEIAEKTGTEEAWSICGTTFYAGIASSDVADKERQYCQGRAIEAFENAISINPLNTQHKINLALCFVEIPPSDNPMKGIQMLLSLNEKFPEDPSVLIQLARLGMQTGQYEKAEGRLLKVLNIDETNKRAVCLLNELYENSGNMEQAKLYKEKCNSL
jgi:tetratricopeptide (TPR) repeat protein